MQKAYIGIILNPVGENTRETKGNTLKYGIIHNNFFYFYYPVRDDGTKMKTQYLKQVWVPMGRGDTKCIAFDTEEAAISAAEDQYYNERSWKVVEVEDDGTIIMTPEIEKLRLGYRPTRADEGEKAE